MATLLACLVLLLGAWVWLFVRIDWICTRCGRWHPDEDVVQYVGGCVCRRVR